MNNEQDGPAKPKARLATLGNVDPQHEHWPTTAATMMKTPRNRMLQLAA